MVLSASGTISRNSGGHARHRPDQGEGVPRDLLEGTRGGRGCALADLKTHIVAPGEIAMMRRFLYWFFRNRETGEVTIAQAPNLVLWVAIAAGVLLWVWPPQAIPELL